MGSGRSGLYPSLPDIGGKGNAVPNTSEGLGGPVNGEDYNTAGSNSVGTVDSANTTSDLHSVPQHGTPNSVSKNYKNGKLDSERYYDANGDAYLDIDYTNHGNSKLHPDVPHEHSIHFDENGKMRRDDPPQGGISK